MGPLRSDLRAGWQSVYNGPVALKSTRPPAHGAQSDVELSPTRRSSSRELDLRVVQAEHKVAQLEEELARERRIGVALREVGLALGTTLDLDQLLELILHKITDAIEADRATLYLLDDRTNELSSRIVQGDEVRSIRLQIGHGIAGHVARTGKPLHVRDAYKDPRFSPEWDMLSGYRTRSILAAPMKNHLGKTIGYSALRPCGPTEMEAVPPPRRHGDRVAA